MFIRDNCCCCMRDTYHANSIFYARLAYKEFHIRRKIDELPPSGGFQCQNFAYNYQRIETSLLGETWLGTIIPKSRNTLFEKGGVGQRTRQALYEGKHCSTRR